ncbi:MAG: hypothetical protein ABL862_04715 [Candidatus Nitrotoga sp.]
MMKNATATPVATDKSRNQGYGIIGRDQGTVGEAQLFVIFFEQS